MEYLVNPAQKSTPEINLNLTDKLHLSGIILHLISKLPKLLKYFNGSEGIWKKKPKYFI